MKGFLRNESGVSAVITALTLTVLLTFTALVIDIGAAYVNASEVQNVSDAIALSLGGFLPIGQTDTAAQANAMQAAHEYAQKNGVADSAGLNVTFEGLSNGKYTSLTVSLEKQGLTRFAGIIGVDSITVQKAATVSAVNAGAVTGAVPIGISEQTYDEAIAGGSTEHVTLKVGGGDGDTGFYGFIVLDESNGNAAVLEYWLKYGFPGENYVGQTLSVATGNKTSAARNGLQYRLSMCGHYAGMGGCTPEHYVESCTRIVFVLVYSFVDSRTVEVVGFTPFLLEAVLEDDEIQGSFIDINISYADMVSDKSCGLYTYRLTK